MEEQVEATPASTVTAQSQGGRNTLRTLGIVLVVLMILAAVGFGGYGLVRYPLFTAVLRDIFIIVLALVTIVIGLFLAILIFQLQSLIALLRNEIKPILESANETASTVRGTTSFVSDAVVTPMISAASFASAVRQTIRTLSGKDRKTARKPKAGKREPGQG
jgi:hypothetical protein